MSLLKLISRWKLRTVSMMLVIALLSCTSSSSLKIIMDEIVAATENQSQLIYGDINNDGKINVYDAASLKSYLINKNTNINTQAADVDGNNKIDISDLFCIKEFILGVIDEFAIQKKQELLSVDRTIVTSNQKIETSLTAEMAKKADELATPTAVYQYLYNNINSEFYANSRKGAIATYEQNGGNDVDSSSLLIAMLRYLGYNAKYATGTIQLTSQQVISLTAANDINSALNILDITTKNIDSIQLKHTWVKVLINDKWIDMDVNIKEYEKEKSNIYSNLTNTGITKDLFKNAITNNDPQEFNSVNLNVQKKCAGLGTDYTFRPVKIITQEFTNIPKIQYIVINEDKNYTDITDDMSDSLTFSLGGQSIYLRSANIYNKKLTIEYQTDEETAMYYDDVYALGIPKNVFGFTNWINKMSLECSGMEPVLKLDGQTIGTGNRALIGDIQELNFTVNTDGESNQLKKRIVVGCIYSIVVDLQNISSNELFTANNDVMKNNSTMTENNIYSDQYIGTMLNFIGKSYFSRLDIAKCLMSNSSNVHVDRRLSIGFFDYQVDIEEGSLYGLKQIYIKNSGTFGMDIISNSYKAYSRNSDNAQAEKYILSFGMLSSCLESTVLEEIIGTQSVSTTAVMDEAVKQNIDILIISNKNIELLNTLKVTSAALDEIKSEINNGNIVTVPQKNITINNWTGVGYTIYKPSTGNTVYKIAENGITSGGRTTNSFTLTGVCAIGLSIADMMQSTLFFCTAATAVLAANPITGPGFLLMATLAVSMVCLAESITAYYDAISLVEAYQSGDESAGQALKTQVYINGAITVSTFGIGAASKAITKLSLFNELKEGLGLTTAENAVNYSKYGTDAVRNIQRLRNLGVDENLISIITQDTKYASYSDDLIKAIVNCGENANNVANIIVKNENVFKSIEKCSGYTNDIVNLISKNGDEFAEDVCTVYSKHIDDSADKLYGLFEAASRKTTRILDSTVDSSIISRVKEIRGYLPSDLKKGGNFGLAEVNIPGVKSELYAHSGIDVLADARSAADKVSDIVIKPTNKIFTAIEVASGNSTPYLRDVDTEYKILTNIAEQIGDNPKISGTITLFTEKPCCESCANVIVEFLNKYKNIKIKVIHNNNVRILP